MPLPPEARIFLAGHRGLAGSALHRALLARGHTRILTRTRAELDLTNPTAVHHFFTSEEPTHVLLAAARQGGIQANLDAPADFLTQNLAIQANVLAAAQATGVERLIFLASSAIYPRLCPQPMRPEHLYTGPLEPTLRPYALAKLAGLELCEAYNRQHATHFLTVVPPNLYGPGAAASSNVLPSLIARAQTAVRQSQPELEIWGSGQARREFLHADDLADACLLLLDLPAETFHALTTQAPPLIHAGTNEDYTISALAHLICRLAGYRGGLRFNSAKPEGTPRKLLDSTPILALGWQPKITLKQGIAALLA